MYGIERRPVIWVPNDLFSANWVPGKKGKRYGKLSPEKKDIKLVESWKNKVSPFIPFPIFISSNLY